MNEDKIKYKLNLVSQYLSEGKSLHAIQLLNSIVDETEDEDVYFQLAELYESMGFVKSGKKVLSSKKLSD